MKNGIKYMVVLVLATLLWYVLLSVFIQNAVLGWAVSAIAAIGILFVIRKVMAKYNFSFIFMVSVSLFVLMAPLLGKKETSSGDLADKKETSSGDFADKKETSSGDLN